ncbi:DUF2927 domain-containing protein [Mesobaculum littorinae]|uniref:DUF2927 domain-containing protein n=1 Tax=Mesobaculum littorinae TaxID=2486419 RepID=A0A438ALN7_9RHOB|nr:DUF2927 domain-containing protein [Mesobaculum littorinae]RVV99763.1 DUF2927 domain-containing protein [Mesobaculum littorinae]
MTARIVAFLILALTLAACAPTRDVPTRRLVFTGELPPMRTFAGSRDDRPTRSNAAIARDFLDLSFSLESGRALPVLTRFEEPITIRSTGRNIPPSLSGDLDRLIGRLRQEAKLDITRVGPGTEASITVESVPRADLQRAVPQAACFVVPRLSSWEEFRKNRHTAVLDWTTLTTRTRMAVFIPSDVSPQEVRDCLHEEIAQALGPLNDLYRLDDSVFNDDNFNAVLTGFDMTVLRTYYAPELASGMTREEVAAQLPGILARVNPAGRGLPDPGPADVSRDWIDAVELSLGPATAPSRRLAAAKTAVRIATERGWHDSRLAFSLYVQGRLSLGIEPDLALASFLQSGAIYAANPATQVHKAHVAMQIAAFALSTGQADAAIEMVDDNTDAVARSQNAALLASLLMVKVEALELQGRLREAEAVRQTALGWARYGFGSDDEVRVRVGEIASLSPRRREEAS